MSNSAQSVVARLKSIANRAEKLVRTNPHALADQLKELAEQLQAIPQQPASDTSTATGAQQATNKTHQERNTGPDKEAEANSDVQPAKKAKKAAREFDFSKYRQRYIALEVMYIGWGFHGFARQENTENTIEGHLLAALRRTRLIPQDADPATLKYSRCGRTDKGVSALGQVVAIMLRSNARAAPAAASCPGCDPAAAQAATEGRGEDAMDGGEGGGNEGEPFPGPEEEIDYPRILNRALPEEIRVLGWAPVPDTFHARFSARFREYKYFIVDSGGDLDLGRMQAAANLFVGAHDYRNFCKLDVLAVKSFDRRIESFQIQPLGIQAATPHPRTSPTPPQPPAEEAVANALAARREGGGNGCGGSRAGVSRVYAMTIRGSAFLWHQVRCMAAVLLMVGRGLEEPSIVSRLLDITATPRKPTYQMAAEEPLLLYACGFEGLSFHRHPRLVEDNAALLRAHSDLHLISAALTATAAGRIAADLPATHAHGGAGAEECGVGAAEPGVASLYLQQQPGGHSGLEALGGSGEAGGRSAGGGGGGGGGSQGGGVRGPPHVPLMKRPTEASVEERMRKHGLPWPPPPREGGARAGGSTADVDVDVDMG